MSILQKVKARLRRRPPTPEDLAARAEAKLIESQMLDDRISQDSRGGQIYRSQRR